MSVLIFVDNTEGKIKKQPLSLRLTAQHLPNKLAKTPLPYRWGKLNQTSCKN